nr:MAG TPA: hypothetical protein [Caudoviricetes sp.]
MRTILTSIGYVGLRLFYYCYINSIITSSRLL